MVRTSTFPCYAWWSPYRDGNMKHIWRLLSGIRLDHCTYPGRNCILCHNRIFLQSSPPHQDETCPTSKCSCIDKATARCLPSHSGTTWWERQRARPGDKQWSPWVQHSNTGTLLAEWNVLVWYLSELIGREREILYSLCGVVEGFGAMVFHSWPSELFQMDCHPHPGHGRSTCIHLWRIHRTW